MFVDFLGIVVVIRATFDKKKQTSFTPTYLPPLCWFHSPGIALLLFPLPPWKTRSRRS